MTEPVERRLPLHVLQVTALDLLGRRVVEAQAARDLYLSAILEGAGVQFYAGARIDGEELVVLLPPEPETP